MLPMGGENVLFADLVQNPRFGRGPSKAVSLGLRQSVQGPTPPLLRQVSKPPEKVAADAVGEIQRQVAIVALGDSTALVKLLQEAL